ncbi:MAG: M48 family metalloprotease, partial [Cyanobacteria bacterium J06635_13]
MFQRLSNFCRRQYRYLCYGFAALVMIVSINLINLQPSYALSWIELMLRGIQIVQISNISSAQEVQLGQSINQELIKSGQAKIYRNQSINSYINQIGQRLAKTSQRPNIPYTFQIVNDENINAFATMGGYVYINKGLITAADNEAELASVMGHE